MQPISLFSLETHDGHYEAWPKKTRLFANGVDTGQSVSGYVVEAQYHCAAGYLLITSYDCPFEEVNDFLLLNDRFETIAKTHLGRWYNTFLLERHSPLSDTALELDYGDGLEFILAIKPRIFGRVKLALRRTSSAGPLSG
jgi:hypothetical protein